MKHIEVLHVFTVTNDEASVKKYFREFIRLKGEEGEIRIRRQKVRTLMYLVRR